MDAPTKTTVDRVFLSNKILVIALGIKSGFL